MSLASAKYLMTTYTGKEVDPLRMTHDMVCIEDIAHHLATINRFGGALRTPVSVAQHSVYVAQLSHGHELQGLLHDASEAYLGDVVKPIKDDESFRFYVATEDDLLGIIMEKFGISMPLHENVVANDRLMCSYEAWRNGISFRNPGPGYGTPTREQTHRVGRWEPWPWFEAEHQFLTHFALYKHQGSR